MEKQIFRLICLRKSRGGYDGKPSIFDNIKEKDIVLAFFPCTRFAEQILLGFRGDLRQQNNYTDEQKLLYSMNLHEELHRNYMLISQLVVICLRKGIRLIIENPYGEQHYLRKYWCIKPKLIDKDRTQNGDYYKKPTQYWFINCEPLNNFIFEALEYVEPRTVKHCTNKDGKGRQVIRSEICPQYANRFIRQYLIDA